MEEEPSLSSGTNRALHCMTAHLHRYGSELELLTETVQQIAKFHNCFHQIFEDQGLASANSYEKVCQGIGLITTHLSSISRFRNELQLKTDNVLALVGFQISSRMAAPETNAL